MVAMRPLRTAGLLACLVALAQAATLRQLSLDNMTEQSTAVVRGRVVGSYAALLGSIIYTHYKIEVLERWKGPESSLLDIVVPGGTAEGFQQSFPGVPRLSEGSEYVLFLWKGSSGLTNIMGLSQGLFDLKRDQGGEATAWRAATAETMLDSAGRLVKDEPVLIRLQALRERVASVLARGVRK